MKLSVIAICLAALAESVYAFPTLTAEDLDLAERGTVEKRATVSDVAATGYATQNGGTSGGKGGPIVTVSSLAALTSAVADNIARIVVVSGTISGSAKLRVGSNKTIIGKKGAKLVGIGIFISKQSNVIIRNIISQNVRAANGDGIGIQTSKNIWVDHCELYSDLSHDKDYYDGLLDITHASEWVTVSYTFLHDHWKASLIGHSDNNGKEDKGHLHVTQHNNYWLNIGSRTPSFRFGTGHVYNSYFKSMNTGIDSRDGAQILVQSNVFSNVTDPCASLYSDVKGYVTAFDNIFSGSGNTAPAGSMTAKTPPYSYSLLGSAKVASTVPGSAGAILTF